MSQQVEIVPAISTTSIAEYSKTEAALADLRARYAGKTYDVTTPEGMKLAKAAHSELRGWRTGLERMRKEIKEPALRRCQEIDTEARRITTELEKLEEPIAAQLQAEADRVAAEKAAREKAEKERIAAIARRIESFRALPLACIGKASAAIDDAIIAANALDLGEMEAADRQLASEVLTASIAAMCDARDRARAQEQEAARLAAERLELDRAKAEQEAERAAKDAEAAELRRVADEAARLEREKDNADRAAEAARHRAELDRQEAEHRARLEAEETERDRVRAAEDARVEQERAEARARIQAEQDALDRRAAELHAEEIEKERVAREAEEARVLAAEKARIEGATLLEAARGAWALLVDRGLASEIETVVLGAAIDRADSGLRDRDEV